MTETAYEGKTAPISIINRLADMMGYATYLEVGVRCPADNYDQVRIATKHGVDINPGSNATFIMSSDTFFTSGKGLPEYDLIYVDADHRELPSLRDLGHALSRLAPRGTVLCDNILPDSEAMMRPAASGDAWKSFAYLRMSRPDLFMCSVDIPFGLGVIRRGQQALFVPDELPYKAWRRDPPVDMHFYYRYFPQLMNVLSEKAFWSIAGAWGAEP